MHGCTPLVILIPSRLKFTELQEQLGERNGIKRHEKNINENFDRKSEQKQNDRITGNVAWIAKLKITIRL